MGFNSAFKGFAVKLMAQNSEHEILMATLMFAIITMKSLTQLTQSFGG